MAKESVLCSYMEAGRDTDDIIALERKGRWYVVTRFLRVGEVLLPLCELKSDKATIATGFLLVV